MAVLEDIGNFFSSANPVSLALTGIGAIGSLFGGSEPEMTDEQRKAYEMLLARARGLDPKLLSQLRARMKGAVGQEHAGLSASMASRLRRQNAPIAKQQEIFDKMSTRRYGAQTDALLGVEQLNEQIKGGALGQLAGFAGGFPQLPGTGAGFGNLFGAGLQGLLQGNYGSNFDFLSGLELEKRRGQGYAYDEPFKRAKLPSPSRGLGQFGSWE